MEGNKVRAPYNFVPFSDKLLIRYESLEELPRHDRIDPALKSGEIQVELKAETPVFVSDGQPDAHFFRGPDGTYQIPGSTVRGLVRENMQILGFGLVRPGEDLDDVQIYFREMAAARGSTGGALKEYYQGALDIRSGRTPSGKTFTTPRNVQGGYLYREGGAYYIRPVRGEVLRVSRSHPDVGQFGTGDARTVPVSYQAADGAVKRLAPAGKPGMAQGELLFTGRPVGRVSNHLYLFPAADEEAEPIPVEKDGDVLSYQMDLEGRSNSLKAYYDVNFWALPKEGERKAVFYIRYEEHTYFGRSRFLRIGYRYPLSQGLPQHHRERLEQGEPVLDYPSAILGFARGKNMAYRSRVSFGDFRLEGKARELPPVKTVLGEPKPSFYPGYVEEGKHYNEDDFRLRGYKQYWLKEAERIPAKKENVASTLRPLDRGSVFRGTIRYKNLTADELGLLLWAIRLDEGCFQTLGMGKPYGYGRMQVTISALREVEPETLYTPDGLCGSPKEGGADAVEQYIRTYDAYAADALRVKKPKKRPSLRSRNEIQDFFFLKQTVRPAEEVSYMDLEKKEYQKIEGPLESVQTVREQAGPEPVQAAPEDPMAALLAKYGRKF